MGEFNEFCPPPKKDCGPPPHKPGPPPCVPMCGRPCCYEKCDNDGIGGFGILIILIVLYCLFCNNNEKGGLFGGLF